MKHHLVWLAPAVVICSAPYSYAITYLTVEQAQALMFPSGKMEPMHVKLTAQQKKEISRVSGIRVRDTEQKIWKDATGGGFFIVDQVLGKHEFITYAVALNADGSVRQIEVMVYLETYGDEIRNEKWRQQFVGKTLKSKLKLDEDIKNISGATLSCRHVTDGVRRLLGLYEVVLKNGSTNAAMARNIR